MNQTQKTKGSYISIDGKMKQYESPWVVPEHLISEDVSELRSSEIQVCYQNRINNADQGHNNVWQLEDNNDNETGEDQ